MLTAAAERLAIATAKTRRRAWSVLLATVLLALAAGSYARNIKVNTDLEALLAENAPSVVALAELRRRQGSTDLLNIAVKSRDPLANRKLVEDIQAEISQWPEVTDSFVELDYTPLRDHALYYVELSELEQLRTRLERQKQAAIAAKIGLGGGEIDPEAVLAGDDWDEDPPELEDDPSAPQPAADAPSSVPELLRQQKDRIAASGRIRPTDLDLVWPQEDASGELIWPDKVVKPLASADQQVMLVRARLTAPPTDLQFATAITTKVDKLFAELDVTSYAPDMLAKIGGAYGASDEAKSIIADLQRATWLSATLVGLVLIGGFRSPRGLVIVLGPLTVALLVTVALARLVLGELNVLTAFLFAVLLGIGVDFAVHLYAQREVQGMESDWPAVIRRHFRPLASSMLTTVGSFVILRLADFKGFKEFGLIAAIGVVVAFFAALILVPVLDRVLGPLRNKPATPRDRAAATGRRKAAWVRLALLGIVGAIGVAGAYRVEFERNMRNLRSPKSEAEAGIAYQKALASTEDTGTPIVVLADTREQLNEAIERVRSVQATDVVPGTDRHWILNVVSLDAQMPSEQAAKQPVLRDIAQVTSSFLAQLPDLPSDAPAQRYRSHLEALERLASASPLRDADLPDWAKQLFRETTGEIGRIGMVYVDVQGYNLNHVVFATERFRELVAGTDVRGASSRFILGDLTRDVERDTRILPPITLLVILMLIGFDLRRVIPTLLTFASLAMGLWLTFGVMGLWPVRINFYNLVVMPAVVGLGIDASIHLWHARTSGLLGPTNRAAVISALTTAGGFAGLLIASHGGLRSIGVLGVVATLGCVGVAVIALGWPRRPA